MIFVYGSTGYLGAAFRQLARDRGYETCRAESFPDARPEVVGKLVVHMSGPRREDSDNPMEQQRFMDSISHSFFLAESLRCPVVFVSSIHVYGSELQGIIDEKHPLDPKDSYSELRIRGESLLFDLHQESPNVAAWSIRFSNGYGIRRFMLHSSMSLAGNVALVDIFRGSATKFSNSKASQRVFSSVDSLNSGILSLIEKTGNPQYTVLNAGLGNSQTPARLHARLMNLHQGRKQPTTWSREGDFRFDTCFSTSPFAKTVVSLEDEYEASKMNFYRHHRELSDN